MSRIEGRLSELRGAGRKALVTFITAGDPDAKASVPALHALVRGGADILELGMPFSDPEAEGPSIHEVHRPDHPGIRPKTHRIRCALVGVQPRDQ